MEHGYDSAFAPAGAIGVREENCIADPSRIETIGLARGYKAPCRYGSDCTRKMRCKFDHGHGDDKRYLWKGAGGSKYSSGNGKHRKRKSPSAKRQATKRQRLWVVAAKQLENRGVADFKKMGERQHWKMGE